ncbi:MAG: hypothetical protein KDK41_16050 [Leptospiraceae bacterium]|nr:hypothetical protein [Leptospiraceae bacterium]
MKPSFGFREVLARLFAYNVWYTRIFAILFGILFLYSCSNNRELPVKLSKEPTFQLTNGGTISTDLYNEYNPVLVKLNNNKLALFYGFDGPCADCTEGLHHIMVAISTSEFDDQSGSLPTFEEPSPLLPGGGPINHSEFLRFSVHASASGVTVYYNNPDNSDNLEYLSFPADMNTLFTSSSSISNSNFQTFTIGGVSEDGTEVMAYDENTFSGYIFNPSGTSDPAIPVDELAGSVGAIFVPASASGEPVALLGLYTGGTFTAVTEDGLLGGTPDLSVSLLREGLFLSRAAGFLSGSEFNDTITFSANDGLTEDIFIVTSHTLADFWQLATTEPEFSLPE